MGRHNREGDEPAPVVQWVPEVKKELLGEWNEVQAGQSGGSEHRNHRNRIGLILYNRAKRHWNLRGIRTEEMRDQIAIVAAAKAQLGFEAKLPACLDFPDAWFGGVLTNCVTWATAEVLEQEFGCGTAIVVAAENVPAGFYRNVLGDDLPANLEPFVAGADDEWWRWQVHLVPMRVAWCHVQFLGWGLRKFDKPTQQRALVYRVAEFYMSKLDKVCPELSTECDWDAATGLMSHIPLGTDIDLPEEEGEIVEFVRKTEKTYSGSGGDNRFHQATSKIWHSHNIRLKAFPAEEDYEDKYLHAALRDPLFVIWYHARALERVMGQLGRKERILKSVVSCTIKSYRSMLDKVCPGLGRQSKCTGAEAIIAKSDLNLVIGLKGRASAIFDDVRSWCPEWTNLSEIDARTRLVPLATEIHLRFKIGLRAFRDGEDSR